MISRSMLIELWQSRIAKLDYEALLERHYRRLIAPGDTVIDIGAHDGRHARVFWELIGSDGHLAMFEPLQEKASNLAAHFPGTAVVHQKALSNFEGTADFVVAHGALQESGLKEKTYNTPDQVTTSLVTVEVDMLDNYTDEMQGLSFIKMDCEGAEIDALSGAGKLIATYRPVISVEYGQAGYSAFGYTGETLFNVASSLGYVLFDMFLNEIADGEAWSRSVDSIYWDFLLIPSEKKDEIAAKLAPTDA